VRAVVELIRQLRPEIVVGHDPWRLDQLHPDHRAVGEIVRDAVWRAVVGYRAVAAGVGV
jgi:LmbE family N-acetylglucosaminyl deacetylase